MVHIFYADTLDVRDIGFPLVADITVATVEDAMLVVHDEKSVNSTAAFIWEEGASVISDVIVFKELQ